MSELFNWGKNVGTTPPESDGVLPVEREGGLTRRELLAGAAGGAAGLFFGSQLNLLQTFLGGSAETAAARIILPPLVPLTRLDTPFYRLYLNAFDQKALELAELALTNPSQSGGIATLTRGVEDLKLVRGYLFDGEALLPTPKHLAAYQNVTPEAVRQQLAMLRLDGVGGVTKAEASKLAGMYNRLGDKLPGFTTDMPSLTNALQGVPGYGQTLVQEVDSAMRDPGSIARSSPRAPDLQSADPTNQTTGESKQDQTSSNVVEASCGLAPINFGWLLPVLWEHLPQNQCTLRLYCNEEARILTTQIFSGDTLLAHSSNQRERHELQSYLSKPEAPREAGWIDIDFPKGMEIDQDSVTRVISRSLSWS